MKTFQISRVYHVAAESIEAARAQLSAVSPTCRIDFESIQPLAVDQPSEAALFRREAVRQLTDLAFGSTRKQEPRRES